MSWFTRVKKPAAATDPVASSDSPAPIEFGDPLDLAIARGARQYEVDRAEALFFARHQRSRDLRDLVSR